MSTLGRVNPGDVFAFYVLGRLTQEEFDQVGDFGRMHGRGWYARTSDLFLMERLSYADWKDGKR